MPLVACIGVAVPQLSGRGLGHTGGTLDKLESIPGWRAALTNDEMFAQLDDVGAVICAAGAGLAPADKKLYALRDVTGTVEAIPLIASSIMSKKIAEGTGALVLDVKFGSGAFLKDIERSRQLAPTMGARGEAAGLPTPPRLPQSSRTRRRYASGVVPRCRANAYCSASAIAWVSASSPGGGTSVRGGNVPEISLSAA
jgi:thymidine phosphorylase